MAKIGLHKGSLDVLKDYLNVHPLMHSLMVFSGAVIVYRSRQLQPSLVKV